MALQKAIDTEFGVQATYWNIGAYAEDFKGSGGEVTMYGYLDQASKQAGKQPLSAGKINLTGVEYMADANRANLYEIIKNKPEFEDSIDV
jgi:hypothetical protein